MGPDKRSEGLPGGEKAPLLRVGTLYIQSLAGGVLGLA